MYNTFDVTIWICRAREGDPSAITDIEEAFASSPKLAGDPELTDVASAPILAILLSRGVVPAGTLFILIADSVHKAVKAMESDTRRRLLADLVLGVARYELANHQARRPDAQQLDELQAEMDRAREQVESAAGEIARASERRVKMKRKPRARPMSPTAKLLATFLGLDGGPKKKERKPRRTSPPTDFNYPDN